MAKIISFFLLSIFFFNNFANATLWPGAKTPLENKYYKNYDYNTSKKNMEILTYCKDRNYQTSMGYYNCLKSFNYPITNTDSKFF
jgi:hypothetical protein